MHSRREIVDAIRYLAHNGCVWRALSSDIVDAIRYLDRTGCPVGRAARRFPPKLVYHYFKTWTADGTLTRMRDHLREQVRQQVEIRAAQPTAALVDSQSLRAAETVARTSRG